MSRSFCTVRMIWSTTKSTSASVVKRPSPNRKEECAISSAAPTKVLVYEYNIVCIVRLAEGSEDIRRLQRCRGASAARRKSDVLGMSALGKAVAQIQTYLQRHQQTLSFNIGKAEVNTSWVAIHIAITDDMFDLRVDFVDQAFGKLSNVCSIPL